MSCAPWEMKHPDQTLNRVAPALMVPSEVAQPDIIALLCKAKGWSAVLRTCQHPERLFSNIKFALQANTKLSNCQPFRAAERSQDLFQRSCALYKSLCGLSVITCTQWGCSRRRWQLCGPQPHTQLQWSSIPEQCAWHQLHRSSVLTVERGSGGKKEETEESKNRNSPRSIVVPEARHLWRKTTVLALSLACARGTHRWTLLNFGHFGEFCTFGKNFIYFDIYCRQLQTNLFCPAKLFPFNLDKISSKFWIQQ